MRGAPLEFGPSRRHHGEVGLQRRPGALRGRQAVETLAPGVIPLGVGARGMAGSVGGRGHALLEPRASGGRSPCRAEAGAMGWPRSRAEVSAGNPGRPLPEPARARGPPVGWPSRGLAVW